MATFSAKRNLQNKNIDAKTLCSSRAHKLHGVVNNEIVENPAPTKRRLISARSICTETECSSFYIAKLNNESVSLYRAEDFLSSLTSFRKALFHCRQALLSSSSEHSAASSTIRRIGTTMYHDGPPPSSYIYQRMDLDEGMDIYSDTILVQPDDHPQAMLAALFFNVGQARRQVRDYQGAVDNYYKALETFLPTSAPVWNKKDVGKTGVVSTSTDQILSLNSVHKVIIPILHNIGQLAYRQGNQEEAKRAFEVSLRHCRRLNGKDDISVGTTLNCLGVIYYHDEADSSDRALQAFEESVQIQTCAVGADARNIATALNNLGRVLIQRKESDKALIHYKRALKIRRTLLGRSSIDYAATAFNMGQSLHMKEDYDRAIVLYNEFLHVAKSKLPRNHRDVAIVLSSLAQIYQARNEHGKALTLFEESITVGKRALGHWHLEVAMLFNRIGNFHFEQDNFLDALVAYREGLRIEKRVLKRNSDPNIIVSLSNIGDVYMHLNEYNKAMKQYFEVLNLQKQCYGPSSEHVASTLSIIGTIYDEMGNINTALHYLQQSLIMRRNVLGNNNLDVAATLIHLGTIFYRLNSPSIAIKLFHESLRIRVDKLGTDNSDVSFVFYNIGLCHQLLGSHEDTIRCFCETLRIERIVFGEEHKDISVTLFNLGKAYKDSNNLTKALECFESALRNERSRINCSIPLTIDDKEEDSTTIAQTLTEIGKIRLAKGEITPMMEAFTEAMRIFHSAGYLSSIDSVLSVPHHLYDFRYTFPCSSAAAA